MQVLSVSQLRVGSLRWQPAEGRHALTVVAKGTFDLVQGKAQFAQVQDFPADEDNHWNDDPSFSLYTASDLVPFKRQADVVLVGEAFASGVEPVRSLTARMVVGSIDKAVEVHCDRHFGQQGELVEGNRFTRMPLRYERAAGGALTTNPVGIDPEGERDLYGRMQVPNLIVPGTTVTAVSDVLEPIGFGPIAPGWPSRRALLGRHAASWSERRWQTQALPADFESAFFNVAPIDQRLEELREDERIMLENLHPSEARLVCHLPGVKPRCFVERGGAVREIPMRADTLWIETSRSVCTVTWRGRVDLESPTEKGRAVVALEKPGDHLTWGAVRKLIPSSRGVRDESTADVPPANLDEFTAIGAPGQPGARALPFVGSRRPSSIPAAAGAPSARSGRTSAFPVQHPHDRSPAWLQREARGAAGDGFAVAPPAAKVPPLTPLPPRPQSSHPPPHPSSAPPPAHIAQARAAPTQDLATALPAGAISPWARKGLDESMDGAAVPMAPRAPAVAAAMPAISGRMAGAMPAASPLPAVRPPNPVEALREPSAPPPPIPIEPVERERKPRHAHEVVELLWYDAEAMPRIKGQRRWADLIEELRRKPDDEPLDFDEEPPPEEPEDVRDRRTVVAIMTRASVLSGFDLQQTMMESVDASGSFEPPLVLMNGRLHLPFDQLETLKATLAAVTPLIAGNKELQETVDAVNELLKTPWLQEGSGEVAEGLTDKVRNAFKRGDRIVDPGYLDDHTERILLERRCYQRRKLFGDEWIRALLSPPSSRARIPTYLPVKLDKDLPMFKSFPTRIIAEAHQQQDQYETHDCALKVVAFGRVVSFTRPAQTF
jgi:hypothetical protein